MAEGEKSLLHNWALMQRNFSSRWQLRTARLATTVKEKQSTIKIKKQDNSCSNASTKIAYGNKEKTTHDTKYHCKITRLQYWY